MADTPTVQHLPEQHKFIIELEGENAYLEYTLGNDNTLMVMHTEVPPAYEGQGYASRLAKETMAYVQQENMKVMPYCAYMATFLTRKKDEYRDSFAPEFQV